MNFRKLSRIRSGFREMTSKISKIPKISIIIPGKVIYENFQKFHSQPRYFRKQNPINSVSLLLASGFYFQKMHLKFLGFALNLLIRVELPDLMTKNIPTRIMIQKSWFLNWLRCFWRKLNYNALPAFWSVSGLPALGRIIVPDSYVLLNEPGTIFL